MSDIIKDNLSSCIFKLEEAMLGGPTIELSVKHYFSKGVYAREIFIPKGTVVVGHIHKYENLNILSKGELSVTTDDRVEHVCAPFTIVSPSGTKRAVYAHEDSIWTTIHGTSETNVEKIEDMFIAKSKDEYISFIENLKGGMICHGQP